MSELTSPELVARPGVYGKLSSHGDFVLRRLPQAFVMPWDTWLQEGIAQSRASLGVAWEESYRAAPVWRFVLAPGACGESAWAGVLQPSIDRVGRYFPLTVAMQVPSNINVIETMLVAEGWFTNVEGRMADAFAPDVQFEAMDARIEQLVFPSYLLAPKAISEDTLPMDLRGFSEFKFSLDEQVTVEKIRDMFSQQKLATGPSDCVWWSHGTAGQESVILITKTLPAAPRFCALLDGKWQIHGWEVARSSGGGLTESSDQVGRYLPEPTGDQANASEILQRGV